MTTTLPSVESLDARPRPRSNEVVPSVLVVDDVHANLIALEALLGNLKCEVVLASSGNEALRQLLKREFAVVLLDVQMPEMDGFEVANHARQNPATADVPIIFVTAAHHPAAGVLRAYGSGAVDFLLKPIEPVVLRSKVSVFLDLYTGKRQIADALEAAEGAYRELQATQAQLVQSEKMASLGQLVAGIAHEINNPLAFVVSHIETIQKSLCKVEERVNGEMPQDARRPWKRARDRLGEVGLGLDRIRDLVLKLRTFSRLDEGERKVVSVRECVESVLTILGHRLGTRIRVGTRYGDPDRIECFPGLLNQAIMNLVGNAIDAIEDTGAITIETGYQGDAYCVSVEDTGGGIPEGVRERIFEPFFTTKPIGQGTGLGLAISYSIARKHGGTLQFEPAKGGGTRMKILIPLGSLPET